MISIFVINLLLINDYYFFLMLFYIQSGFYFMTLLSLFMKNLNYNIGLLNLPLFFVSTNIALFIGFFKNIIGIQTVKWDSTERII